ncbi:phosphoesterase, putative [Minicystis rosea]|nr:phosphoesterase, putative [Minicystis rosea]
MAKRTHRRETIDLRDGSLRLVVVADTHSHPHPDTARRIAALAPDHILHAGDIGALSVLDDLRKLAPLTAVRGNIDVHAPEIPDVITLDFRDGDRTLITALLLHIALYGGKIRAEVARMAKEEDAALVLCGHSHVPFLGKDRGLTAFNPGSIGPRRFSLPIVLGVVEISRQRVSMRHVDCETGETWMPPGLPARA